MTKISVVMTVVSISVLAVSSNTNTTCLHGSGKYSNHSQDSLPYLEFYGLDPDFQRIILVESEYLLDSYYESGELYSRVPVKPYFLKTIRYFYNEIGLRDSLVKYKPSFIRVGTYVSWHTNGKIKSVGPFINGWKAGYWKEYDNRGILISAQTIPYQGE